MVTGGWKTKSTCFAAKYETQQGLKIKKLNLVSWPRKKVGQGLVTDQEGNSHLSTWGAGWAPVSCSRKTERTHIYTHAHACINLTTAFLFKCTAIALRNRVSPKIALGLWSRFGWSLGQSGWCVSLDGLANIMYGDLSSVKHTVEKCGLWL